MLAGCWHGHKSSLDEPMKRGLMGCKPAKPNTIEKAEAKAKRIEAAMRDKTKKRQWTLPGMNG